MKKQKSFSLRKDLLINYYNYSPNKYNNNNNIPIKSLIREIL